MTVHCAVAPGVRADGRQLPARTQVDRARDVA
jgi:hypothetical protein